MERFKKNSDKSNSPSQSSCYISSIPPQSREKLFRKKWAPLAGDLYDCKTCLERNSKANADANERWGGGAGSESKIITP